MKTKWCLSLVAVMGKERELDRLELVSLLGEGAKLGLVNYDLEEGNTLH